MESHLLLHAPRGTRWGGDVEESDGAQRAVAALATMLHRFLLAGGCREAGAISPTSDSTTQRRVAFRGDPRRRHCLHPNLEGARHHFDRSTDALHSSAAYPWD